MPPDHDDDDDPDLEPFLADCRRFMAECPSLWIEMSRMDRAGAPRTPTHCTEAGSSLASGRCSAVLAWPDGVGKEQLARLPTAARQGDALCLLWLPLTKTTETRVRGKKTAAPAG